MRIINNDSSGASEPKRPRISIGVPVFNGAKYMREALDSILSQTFDDFEVIISDNASTDETPDICKQYAKADKRIKYIALEKNLGAAYNYNHVYNLSVGEYFKWAADDDILDKGFLSACVKVLDQNKHAVLCSCKSNIIDGMGKLIALKEDELKLDSTDIVARFSRTLRPMNFCHCGIFGLIRKSSLAKTHLIGNYLASDRVLISELSLYGPIIEIEERLFYRRKHERNIGISIKDVKFYDPFLKPAFVLPDWKVLLEQYKNVKRAPLNASTKRQLIKAILRNAYSNRNKYKWQLKDAICMALKISKST